jgi:hypothetical protein
MDVYGRIEGGYMIYALHLNSSVGNLKSEYTTLWLDTDFKRSTGYSVPTTNVSGAPQVQVGAEYNIRFDVAGHVLLEQGNTLWPAYSPNGAAVYSELVAPVQYAFSADYKSAEVAIPLSMLGPTVAGAKVHVTSYWAVGPALTADGYTLGTPPTGGGGGQPPPPIVTAALLHDTGALSSDGITSDPTLTGTGTASAIVQFRINDTTSAVTTTDAMGKWTWTPTGLSQGYNSIVASQTDANGNIGSATVNLTYDTAAPAVAITSNGGSIASATQTVSGTGEQGTQIALFDGSTALGVPVLVGVDGTWSASVTFTGSGAHVVTANDTDKAGNIGHSSPVTFTLSIPPPQVQPPVFTGMSQNYSGSVTLKGSGPANAPVSVYDGATRIGTATVGAAGTWKFNTSSNLSDSVHIFTAATTDALGNVSGASGSAQLGSSRADKLTSTNGNDIMTGDSRADTFSFAANFGKDVITDFVAGGSGHDFIDFTDISVLNSFSAVMSRATDTSAGVVIRQDANNTLTLLDVSKSELRAMDFTFSHAT